MHSRGMIASADARASGPLFICGDLDRWLDEPTSAAPHRIPHRGESGSSRTDWQSTDEIQRQSALSIGNESEKAWPQTPRTGGDHRHSGNSIGVAPKIDCSEV